MCIRDSLGADECDHFIQQAAPRMARSVVVDAQKMAQGTIESTSQVRTSTGAFLARAETPVVSSVEERIAQWVMVEQSQGEGFQILNYKVCPICSRVWRSGDWAT